MASETPCWWCQHFNSIDPRSEVVSCALLGSSTKARQGCGSYERVPGVDDDEWSPVRISIAPYQPDAPSAPRARSHGSDGWWTEPARSRRPAPVIAVVPVLVPARDPFGALFNWQDD